MLVDTYRSWALPSKYLTVRTGTRMDLVRALVGHDPDLHSLVPLQMSYPLSSEAPDASRNQRGLSRQVQSDGFAVHYAGSSEPATSQR